MGGNALGVKTSKLTKAQEITVAARVATALREECNKGAPVDHQPFHIATPTSVSSKKEFGDVDMLCAYDSWNGSVGLYEELYDMKEVAAAWLLRYRSVLTTSLGATVVVQNGGDVSFDTPLPAFGRKGELDEDEKLEIILSPPVQVDLKFVPLSSFDFALKYYSFGDYGSILGRVANSIGVTLRHTGLWYRCSIGDSYSEDILVTKEWTEAMQLLGFNSRKEPCEFYSSNGMWEWVSSSEHFNEDSFKPKSLNAKDRNSLLKRPGYIEFLSWLDGGSSYDDYKPRVGLSQEGLISKLMAFPGFEQKYRKAIHEYAVDKLIRDKFNGNIVEGVTGYCGRQLGTFIEGFKLSFQNETMFEDFVLTSAVDRIEKAITVYRNERELAALENNEVL
jgi:hypothetical protein